MCTYFKRKTDVAQNLIDDFVTVTLWLSEQLSVARILGEKKKYGGTGLLSQKTEALYVEPNKRAEAAISSYFAAGDFLHGIYSVLVAKNHLKIRLRCSVHEFSFTDIF